MKNFYAVLTACVIFLTAALNSSAQITMTFPKGVAYTNNIPVGWTTSSPPAAASIQLIFTSKATPVTVWTLTFSTATNISSGTFSFNPLSALTNSNFSSVSPAYVV